MKTTILFTTPALALLLGASAITGATSAHAQLRLAHEGEVHPDKPKTGQSAAEKAAAPDSASSEESHAMPKRADAPPPDMGAMRNPNPDVPKALPPLPTKLPAWMNNTRKNHIFYKRGAYNYDVYNVRPLALDLNAVAVGHALAYEDLVTGKAATLETKTFERIQRVLKNPPKFMPDEASLSPTFGRKYGVLEQVFDWTHILHAQTVDVLASTKLTHAEKEREIEALWKFYFESVPYAISPLPLNMEWLDSQPYSMAFRTKYPKVNGLFWGYHWLQGTMYDSLYGLTLEQQKRSYEIIGKRYHTTELYRTDRPFMPMFAEVSPRFAARFPHIANAFDNLHMLHDMVNDILASPWMSERQKDDQIKRAMWIVSADAHRNEKPGDNGGGMHDHRFMEGMPGMGMMKGSTTEVMWMDGMGWMSMSECHHCTMPLPRGKDEWRSSGITADGWTMRVRCALCARDMSAETKGAAVLRIPLEAPDKTLVVIADEAGNLTTNTPDVIFIEEEGSHAKCHEWSRAFSNRAAFEKWVQDNPKYADAKLLTFAQWAKKEGDEPDTYVKPKGPVEGNPYAPAASVQPNAEEAA
jgi:hypothetical protein